MAVENLSSKRRVHQEGHFICCTNAPISFHILYHTVTFDLANEKPHRPMLLVKIPCLYDIRFLNKWIFKKSIIFQGIKLLKCLKNYICKFINNFMCSCTCYSFQIFYPQRVWRYLPWKEILSKEITPQAYNEILWSGIFTVHDYSSGLSKVLISLISLKMKKGIMLKKWQ